VPCSYCTENCTNSLVPSVGTKISHKKKKFIMVMNTCSRSQNDRQPIQPEPVIQSNQQPPPFSPPREGEQDRIVALKAHIEALTRQNAELLLKNMGQPHLEMNWDEHEEEECNGQVNGHGYREEDRRENDRQKENFREGDPWGLRNGRLQRPGGREKDARGLSRILA
jgi:hypothetical protein